MSALTISKFAQQGGVGVETIRYYQRRGLLPEPQRPTGSGLGGGVRRYDDADVRRLRFIRTAQTAGFTLEEIGELLELDALDDRARAREMARARVAAFNARSEPTRCSVRCAGAAGHGELRAGGGP
jgi:MerR family mercuric resistance operon transcriptional regulator